MTDHELYAAVVLGVVFLLVVGAVAIWAPTSLSIMAGVLGAGGGFAAAIVHGRSGGPRPPDQPPSGGQGREGG
jgi:hypothetical protein